MLATARATLQRRASVFFVILLVLGAPLLVACENPPAPRQLPDQTPKAEQPALRPRATTSAPTTTPEAAQTTTSGSPPAAEGSAFVQVATGENHWCALRQDGKAVCWGPNDQGQRDVPTDARFQQITSGWGFSCGLQTDGRINCWGRNNHKQTDPPAGHFTAIDAGWDHACALSGANVTCWGRSADERATPPSGVEFTAIGAGAEHSCGLTASGDLVCWGKNDNGRATSRPGPFRALAVGITHTCVLREDGTALCQGESSDGQSSPPIAPFTDISAGADHTCGSLETGHLECWGGKADGAAHASYAPPGRFTSVSLGWESGCGVISANQVACWRSAHAPRPPEPYGRLLLDIVAPGVSISAPTEALPWPSGGLLIAERSGAIMVLTPEFNVEPLLDLSTIADSNGGEKGFLSVAIDPQFEDYEFIYVYYTLNVGDDPTTAFARLSRFSVINGSAARDSELVILDILRHTQSEIHWGGAIRFGPDGTLYLGIGDSSCLDCPQDLSSLHGKIIRIDVREASADQPYRIPEDNPFADVPDARPEVWALGMRNPWRMAFDSQDGSLWVADVGERFEEEVTVVTPGANLGWPVLEGQLCSNLGDVADLDKFAVEKHTIYHDNACSKVEQFTSPIITYTNRRSETCAVIGGSVYRGAAIPWLSGTYFFGDFCSGLVWALDEDADAGRHMIQIADLDHLITSFGVDENGELLILTFAGPVFRLAEAAAGLAPSVTRVPLATVVTAPPQSGAAGSR